MQKWIVSTCRVLAAWSGAAARRYAQNAQITGTLKDQSGAVLPGVTVTAHEREPPG